MAGVPATEFSARDGWHYGLMGLPLAFVALPLYVHLPHLYGQVYGFSLSALGAILLGVRLLDALIDPWLGRWCDVLFARTPVAVLQLSGWACAMLGMGMWGLLMPPSWAQNYLGFWLALGLVLVYLAFSLLTIAHQSWGARLGGAALVRARIVTWREGLGLVGVVSASVLPSLIGWGGWVSVLMLALGLAWWQWHQAPRPTQTTGSHNVASAIWRPWRSQAFRQLIAVFVVNGSASAVPATLVLFFIQDRLGGKAFEGLFLGVYFLSAAISLPVWLRLVKASSLVFAWGCGMLLSIGVFAWVLMLGHGDLIAYAIICALSGAALGADLAIPSALLALLVAKQGDESTHAGAYFGWWHVATKLNLALAAGVSLPLLSALGYAPGSTTVEGLLALSWVYAALPCVLKTLAAVLLWRTAKNWSGSGLTN